MNSLQQQLDALQATVAALAARVQAVENQPGGSAPAGDAVDNYGVAMQERLEKLRQAQNGKYAVAVSSIVSQINNSGSSGTAFSIITADKGDELLSDSDIETKVARVRLYVSDTLVLRCLREFVALCFEGKSREATAAELAARLQTDASRIDAVLSPLVQNETLKRGLRADGTQFYQWDGNNHLAMMLLFHG